MALEAKSACLCVATVELSTKSVTGFTALHRGLEKKKGYNIIQKKNLALLTAST